MRQKRQTFLAKFSVFIIAWTMIFGSSPVSAAELTYMKDILTRTQVSALSNHTITFKLPTALTEGQAITIYFLTGASGQSANFTLASLSSTRDVDITTSAVSGSGVDQCDSGVASYPVANLTTTNSVSGSGVLWGFQSSTDNVAHKLTLTAPTTAGTFGDIPAASCVRIRIGSNASGSPTIGSASTTVTNPASATTSTNQYIIKITTPSDSGELAAGIVLGDQPTANATASPSMTFEVGVVSSVCTNSTSATDLTTSSLAFNTLSAQYVQPTTNFLCTRVSTNAANGAVVQIKSQFGQMTSSQAKLFPATAVTTAPTAALAMGITTTTYNLDTEAYGICLSDSQTPSSQTTVPAGGSIGVSDDYDGGDCGVAANGSLNGQNFGKLSTQFDTLWSTSGAISLAYANFLLKAAVSVTTPPGNDYRDTLTVIAFATF